MGKIQDEAEVIRWIEQGRTFEWMSQEYERRDNLVVAPSVFDDFRRERGVVRRIVRNEALVPWAVRDEHRWAYAAAMLRMEARRRAGFAIRPEDLGRLESWKRQLQEHGDLVVDYDPATEQGFRYAPRRPGVDLDLIREPGSRTMPGTD